MKKIRKKSVRPAIESVWDALFFEVKCNQLSHHSELRVKFPEETISTQSMPIVVEYLRQRLPSVLETKCFNGQGLSFEEELANTEIAHLFEHVILALYCQTQTSLGLSNVVVDGVTEWDWSKYPKGTFDILLSIRDEEANVLQQILPEAIQIIDDLLSLSGFETGLKNRQAT